MGGKGLSYQWVGIVLIGNNHFGRFHIIQKKWKKKKERIGNECLEFHD